MKSISRLILWLILLLVSIYLHRNADPSLSTTSLHNILGTEIHQSQIYATLGWFFLFLLINGLINLIFWNRKVGDKIGNQAPEILKIVTGSILFLIFLCIVTTQVFEKSIAGLLAFTGGLGILIGLALRNSIVDFASGIAIHFEKPFKLGDYILLHNLRRGKRAITGQVVSINWRSLSLKTEENNIVIVPNNQFSNLIVTNFSKPSDKSFFELEFCINFDVDIQRAKEIISSALYTIDSILQDPKPKVRVKKTTLDGVVYVVEYCLFASYYSIGKAKDEVISTIIKYLNYGGISLAYNKADIYSQALNERKAQFSDYKRNLITGIPIFKSLSDADAKYLYEKMININKSAGTVIVTEGQEDDTMYIISEGYATVYMNVENTDNHKEVGKLGAGQFFGEMSMVLGEPRSATVIAQTDVRLYQISKQVMKDLFNRDQDLLKNVVNIIEQRKENNQNILSSIVEENPSKEDRYEIIKQKIISFFK